MRVIGIDVASGPDHSVTVCGSRLADGTIVIDRLIEHVSPHHSDLTLEIDAHGIYRDPTAPGKGLASAEIAPG